MKEILYILLDNYAEHEIGFMPGAVSTDATGFRKEPKYTNKMVAPTMEPVKSIGGMRTLPDYSFETIPAGYAGVFEIFQKVIIRKQKMILDTIFVPSLWNKFFIGKEKVFHSIGAKSL